MPSGVSQGSPVARGGVAFGACQSSFAKSGSLLIAKPSLRSLKTECSMNLLQRGENVRTCGNEAIHARFFERRLMCARPSCEVNGLCSCLFQHARGSFSFAAVHLVRRAETGDESARAFE